MGGVRFPLPARDRILLHLSEFNIQPVDEGSYPPALTQDGIASRTGLGRAHVAIALKSLREEGLVAEVKGRVAGEARRRKVYALSEQGRGHCRSLLAVVMDMDVAVRVEGAPERRTRLSEASFVLPRKTGLVDLALSVGEGATLRVGADGLLVRVQESGEGEAAAPGGEQEAETSGERPAGEMPGPPPPSPEEVFLGEGIDDGGAPGPGQPAPGTAGAQIAAAPPAPVLPASPWILRGQLAAVWGGALAMSLTIIWLGTAADEPVTPGFMAIYFLVMATLQAVLIGMSRIPSAVRAHTGLFLGLLLAFYGGFQAFGPPFPSLLWFTEGLLLLSTGLLVHQLDNDQKFCTAGAAAGAFMMMLGAQWAIRPGDVVPRLLAALWIPVGILFMAARFHPGLAGRTAHLKNAVGISAGCFLLAIGAFLIKRGFAVESFVEFLVGGIMLFYAIPRKREDWDAISVAITASLILMVVATTYFVLDQFLGHMEYFKV